MDFNFYRLKKKALAAKFVITISEFGRAHFLYLLGLGARQHVSTVHLGVDVTEFSPAARRHVGEDLHVVCVGRLVREKAQDTLLEAMVKVLAAGQPMRLTLVGDGAARKTYERVAEELGIADRVTFTGALPLPETRNVMHTADVFVLPSFAEGIPVALMEAMALEIPCISTRVAGIPELIDSGKDGLLLQPGNVSELASALLLLAGRPQLRHALGEAARVKVSRDFNLDRNVAVLADVFAHHLTSFAAGESRREPAEVPGKVVAA